MPPEPKQSIRTAEYYCHHAWAFVCVCVQRQLWNTTYVYFSYPRNINIIIILYCYFIIFIIRRLLYVSCHSIFVGRTLNVRSLLKHRPVRVRCPWTKRRASLIRILITENVSNHTGPVNYDRQVGPRATNMIIKKNDNNRYHLHLMIFNENKENVSICTYAGQCVLFVKMLLKSSFSIKVSRLLLKNNNNIIYFFSG